MSVDDTDPKARAVQLDVLRRLGPSGRVQIVAEMSEDVRRIALEAEQRRHPELDVAEVRRSVLGRMWGQTLADKVYDKIR